MAAAGGKQLTAEQKKAAEQKAKEEGKCKVQ